MSGTGYQPDYLQLKRRYDELRRGVEDEAKLLDGLYQNRGYPPPKILKEITDRLRALLRDKEESDG